MQMPLLREPTQAALHHSSPCWSYRSRALVPIVEGDDGCRDSGDDAVAAVFYY